MNKKRLIQLAGLMLALAHTVAISDDAPSLKVIMQGLRDNLVEISDGLLKDDFEQVIQGATSIAEHPQIAPAQVQLVASALGPEMAAFKQLDNVVHDLSLEISASAKALDRDAAILSYQRMIEGCLDCHRTYMKRVTVALKPEPYTQSTPPTD